MKKGLKEQNGNQQVTKEFDIRVGTPEAVCPLTFSSWLAGLIDGDGCLLVSKEGYSSIEITIELSDEHALQIIKNKLGGSIKLRSGSRSLRYRLHHKAGILRLIHAINGEIRFCNRIPQLIKVCDHFAVDYVNPQPLHKKNSWFSGVFDADGTVTFSFKGDHPQLCISVTNKYKENVLHFQTFFGGNVYYDKAQNGYYKWMIFSKNDVINFLDYIKKNPVFSHKKNRLHLVPRFYELKALRAYMCSAHSQTYKAWTYFMDKWGY